jgi:hypothetical protein
MHDGHFNERLSTRWEESCPRKQFGHLFGTNKLLCNRSGRPRVLQRSSVASVPKRYFRSEMFETIRMTVELMQAQHTIDHSQLSMLQFSELESSSSSSSDFSLSDYADRYTTARDAYLEVCRTLRV